MLFVVRFLRRGRRGGGELVAQLVGEDGEHLGQTLAHLQALPLGPAAVGQAGQQKVGGRDAASRGRWLAHAPTLRLVAPGAQSV